jgi:hypothetical protein
MKKILLISGCSYGIVYSEIAEELKNLFEVDEVVNISQRKASPERQIRGVIEWIAQHGKPDMLIMPVSHYNRFDLPIAKSHDPLHSVHYPMTWHSKDHDREKIADSIDLDTLKTYLKAGLMIDQLPAVHDTLFTRLITFQAYLQFNNIRHLIFDTGNAYKTNHILGLRDNQSKDYLPGLSKTNLVLKCPGIYNFFSFCSNIWMYENCVTDHKNYVPWNEDKPLPYPLTRDEKLSIHHRKEVVLSLMKYLKDQGAVFG